MPPTTAREPLLPDTERALAHRVAVEQARGRTPSLVAGVVRGGETVWRDGRGLVDGAVPHADTQYRIGSITKTFVAVLVMRLREEGLVDLDAPLATYLPGTPADGATLAQLLAHGAGLPAETPGPWWERVDGSVRPELADLVAGPLPHRPGRRHHYSNPGFALLGALVGRLRGRPWVDVLADEVLAPLGLGRTTYHPVPPHATGWAVHPWADVLLPEPAEDAGLMAPAGQLWSTVDDLGRYAAFLLAGDDRVLPAAVVAEMRVPAVPTEAPDWQRSQGLGLQLARAGTRVLAGHTGSMPGFLATLWCDPEQDVAAVVMANATSGPAVGAAAADLVGVVAEREPRLPTPWAPAPEAADPELLALVGPWYWGPTAFALRLRSGPELYLCALVGAGRASRFRPAGDGTWVGLDGYYAGEVLRPVRRAGELHLDLGGFVFTREPYAPADVVPGVVDPAGWR